MKQLAIVIMYLDFTFAVLDVMLAFALHRPSMFLYAAVMAGCGGLMEAAIKARYPNG